LGKYYFETGKWGLATEYLMQATGSIISSSIEEIKRIDPDYNFLIDESTDKSLENVLNEPFEDFSKKSPDEILDISFVNVFEIVNSTPVLKEYFKSTSFYEYFYYLGKSLMKSGYEESGSYILEKIYVRPETGKWGTRSRKEN
jgi:hypothetical protein